MYSTLSDRPPNPNRPKGDSQKIPKFGNTSNTRPIRKESIAIESSHTRHIPSSPFLKPILPSLSLAFISLPDSPSVSSHRHLRHLQTTCLPNVNSTAHLTVYPVFFPLHHHFTTPRSGQAQPCQMKRIWNLNEF